MAPAVPARDEPRPHRSAPPWLASTLLVAGIVLAYAHTLHAPFVFDDAGAVVNNPTIRHLGSLEVFCPPADGSTTTGRPFVNFTYALNYALSGENVWSYHVVNLAIHALAALTLLGLIRSTLLKLKLPTSTSAAAANAAAALWALHPLQTESVTCIAQRTESLCGLLCLLTLYAFVRGRFALSVVACVLGMATKEVVVVAPLLVFLYDRTFVAGSFGAAWRARRRYYLALAGTWLVLLALVVAGSGARGASAGLGLGVSPWDYLLTQCDALVLYLRLAVWPHPLVLDYGTAVVTSVAAVWWQGLVILALLGATSWALIYRPVFGFAGAWFFLLLAPSSSVVPLVTQTVAEHRVYLALAALVVPVVMFLHIRLPRCTGYFFLVLALLAGGLTFARNWHYRSALALWGEDVAHHPHARVLTAYGVALLHAGRATEALPQFERALALDASHLAAARNRALALLHLGRASEAAAILVGLPAREPGEAAEFFALGNAFAHEQKFPEAAAAYARTVALDATHFAARVNLGNALFAAGRPAEAISAYEAALRLRPGDAGTRENLQLAREALR